MNKDLNIKSYFEKDLEEVKNSKVRYESLWKRIKVLFWTSPIFISFIIATFTTGELTANFFPNFFTYLMGLYLISIFIFVFIGAVKGSIQVKYKDNCIDLFEKIKKRSLCLLFPDSFEILDNEQCNDIIQNRFPNDFYDLNAKDKRFLCMGAHNAYSFLYSQLNFKNSNSKRSRNGHFMILESKQTIDGRLIIGKKNKWNLFGEPEHLGLSKLSGEKGHKFNKNFDVYGTHSYISDKILTTEFMYHLVKLKKDFKNDFFMLFNQDHFCFIASSYINWDKWDHFGFRDIDLDEIFKDIDRIKKMRDTIQNINIHAAFKRVSE